MTHGPSDPRTVAAFDVDGTLTTRDCVLPFLVRAGGWYRVVRAVVRHPWLVLTTGIGRGDRDRVKAIVVGGAVRGVPRRRLDDLGTAFAAEVGSRWLRRDVYERLVWHRQQGHAVVLVSASLRAYLEPLARDVLGGVEAVLCTDVETGPDGVCTGRLLGANCRAAEKARRMTEWLAGETVVLWAYGDSAGDRELLAMAKYPVWVRGVRLDPVPVSGRP